MNTQLRECGYCHEPVLDSDVLCPSCGVLLAAYESPVGAVVGSTVYEPQMADIAKPVVSPQQPGPLITPPVAITEVPEVEPAWETEPETAADFDFVDDSVEVETETEPSSAPIPNRKWWDTADEIPSIEELHLAEDIDAILEPDVPATTVAPASVKRKSVVSADSTVRTSVSGSAARPVRHSTPFATNDVPTVAKQQLQQMGTRVAKKMNTSGAILVVVLVALVFFNVASAGPGLMFVGAVLLTGLVFTFVMLRLGRRSAMRRTMDMPYDNPKRKRKS